MDNYIIAVDLNLLHMQWMFLTPNWGAIILFGEFKFYFYIYLFLAIGLPFVLKFKQHTNRLWIMIGAVSAVIGTYLGRYVFVYGGNAYPMSNRFL